MNIGIANLSNEEKAKLRPAVGIRRKFIGCRSYEKSNAFFTRVIKSNCCIILKKEHRVLVRWKNESMLFVAGDLKFDIIVIETAKNKNFVFVNW